MSDSSKALCKCGEELPSGKKGEVLHCIHCERNYRALGNGKVELATDNLVSTQEGDAEVFRFDVPSEAELKGSKSKSSPDAFDDKGTIKINLREKRRQAEKRRSAITARASGQTIPDSSTRPKAMRPRQGEIPGGIMPMIIFIILFNALAFVGLAVLFPTKDGMTATPWGTSFAKPRIPWLEMLTLVLGHVMGFGAWAVYVHGLHKKQKAAREKERAEAARANDEEGEDDDEDDR